MNRRGFLGMIAALFVAKPVIQAATVTRISPTFTDYFAGCMLPAIDDMMMKLEYPLRVYTPARYGLGIQVSKEMLEQDAIIYPRLH